MAGEHLYLEEDYEIEIGRILRPIYENSKSRNIYPVETSLKPHTRQAEFFEQVDDLNYSYRMVPTLTRSEFAIKPSTVETPVISTSLSYPWDELQVINDGKLPYDDRQRDISKVFNIAEDRIALAGATAAVDGTAVTSVSTTGTNSVAASAEFDVTTWALFISTLEGMIGQLIDGLEELNDPLVFVMTPDVYKVLRGLNNANTDRNAPAELMTRLTDIHPNSTFMSTKWLGGSPSLNALKQGFTNGTTNACLFNYNAEYYRIDESVLEIRSKPVNKIDGLLTQWVRRWRPVYRKKEAIIYSGTAVIA